MSRKQEVLVFECSYNFGKGNSTQTLISARDEKIAAKKYADLELKVDGAYVNPIFVSLKPANSKTNNNGTSHEITYRKMSLSENIFGTNGEIVEGIDGNYVKIVKELNNQF